MTPTNAYWPPMARKGLLDNAGAVAGAVAVAGAGAVAGAVAVAVAVAGAGAVAGGQAFHTGTDSIEDLAASVTSRISIASKSSTRATATGNLQPDGFDVPVVAI